MKFLKIYAYINIYIYIYIKYIGFKLRERKRVYRFKVRDGGFAIVWSGAPVEGYCYGSGHIASCAVAAVFHVLWD